jgi:hypothetical protein
MRFLRIFTLSLFPLLAFAQTVDQDWRFAQPGATLVGGLRVAGLLQSSILNQAIEQSTAKDPMMATMVGMMRTALGNVSDIKVSVLDIGAGKDPEVLTLITGHMDEAAATAFSQGKATVHRVDANTLLLGEGRSLADAIQRLSEPAPALQNRAVERGRALADYDLWIAGSLPAMPMTAALGDMLHGLALGISMRDDLRLEVSLDTASVEMAEELIRQARKAQREQPEVKDIALVTDVDGSTARFRVTVDKSVIAQAIAQRGGDVAPIFGALPTAAGPKFPTVEPKLKEKDKEPVRKTIMIYGLDDGPREISPNPAR